MKQENRCAMQCHCNTNNRRDFLKKTAFFAAGASLMGKMAFGINNGDIDIPVIKSYGQASKHIPKVRC